MFEDKEGIRFASLRQTRASSLYILIASQVPSEAGEYRARRLWVNAGIRKEIRILSNHQCGARARADVRREQGGAIAEKAWADEHHIAEHSL